MGSCALSSMKINDPRNTRARIANYMMKEVKRTGDLDSVKLFKYRINLADFEIIECLGKSNATIARVQHKKTFDEYAMKIININKRTEEEVQSLMKEIKVYIKKKSELK